MEVKWTPNWTRLSRHTCRKLADAEVSSAAALAVPRIDEREMARDLSDAEPTPLRAGQRVLADNWYRPRSGPGNSWPSHGVELIRPAHEADRNRATSRSSITT
jgi:hypothetical protein